MSKLVQHHVKYKELHGVDEIKIMTVSEHIRLHQRLRREGKCNVPVDELTKISSAAGSRSPNSQQKQKEYNVSIRCAYIRKQSRKQTISFYDSFGVHTGFIESIRFNPMINKITYSASFKAQASYILPIINID